MAANDLSRPVGFYGVSGPVQTSRGVFVVLTENILVRYEKYVSYLFYCKNIKIEDCSEIFYLKAT